MALVSCDSRSVKQKSSDCQWAVKYGAGVGYSSDCRQWCGSVDGTDAAAGVATSATARWNQAWFVLRRLSRSRRLIKYAPPRRRPTSHPIPGRSRPRQRLRRPQEGRCSSQSLALRFDQYRTRPNSSSWCQSTAAACTLLFTRETSSRFAVFLQEFADIRTTVSGFLSSEFMYHVYYFIIWHIKWSNIILVYCFFCLFVFLPLLWWIKIFIVL